MKNIKEIVINGYSGYCFIDNAYMDKLIIKPDGIKYVYEPMQESKTNRKRNWSYNTTSEEIELLFYKIADKVLKSIRSEIMVDCTDVGGIEFQIIYDDNSKEKRLFFTVSDDLVDTFRMIKKMVPPCEEIPEVLKTSEDYE